MRIRGKMTAVLALLVGGCASATPAAVEPTGRSGVTIARVSDVAAADPAVASADIIVTGQTTSRIMRVPAGGAIAEHHHPHFEEVFFVHAGAVTLALDDREYALATGDAAFIPAGTVISGRNPGPGEAVLIVSWSRMSEGPLTVPGRGH